VKIQAEWMLRNYDAAATTTLPAAFFQDHGYYAQVVWGLKPMWTLGARLEAVGGDVGDDPLDPRFQPRQRASLEATWYPTEYSKLRAQYSYDRRTGGFEDANSVWLQLEFLLGAHAAHKF
jgi:outer membrane receptor protein involved in Fe transport